MKILVVDSGGRGHALAWKIVQSPHCAKLYIAPGNGGTQAIGENVPIGVKDVKGLLRFAEREGIDLTVASQDDSLALGIVDAFQSSGLRIFGPTRDAAEIETSKAFAKVAMDEARVPTAAFETFRSCDGALAYIRERGGPIVVKASGLALGKGAYVCKNVEEAQDAIAEIMVKRVHGDAGNKVVVEDYLPGPEVSIHAFCDGNTFSLFPSAQDHKPALDNDLGKNTGGMGTIAPLPWVSAATMQEVGQTVVGPILKHLSRLGRPFSGCLYPGLKVAPTGLAVLEFNARPGDPETQSYMRLLRTDLTDILVACADGKLAKCKVEWNPGYAATIVLASGGYPGSYKKGLPISGIKEAEQIPGVVVFHAGTTVSADGVLVTAGGRVLGVTAIGNTLENALLTAYEAVKCIHFDGMQLRHDIGANSLKLAQRQAAS